MLPSVRHLKKKQGFKHFIFGGHFFHFKWFGGSNGNSIIITLLLQNNIINNNNINNNNNSKDNNTLSTPWLSLKHHSA